MEKYQDKIVVYKNFDRELFTLLENISVVKFGTIKFRNNNIEDIKIKNSRPTSVITIRESVLLGNNKNANDYGD